MSVARLAQLAKRSESLVKTGPADRCSRGSSVALPFWPGVGTCLGECRVEFTPTDCLAQSFDEHWKIIKGSNCFVKLAAQAEPEAVYEMPFQQLLTHIPATIVPIARRCIASN
jgi:hypothetical protein